MRKTLKKVKILAVCGLVGVCMFFQFIFLAEAQELYQIDPAASAFFDSLGYHKAYVIQRIVDFETEHGKKVFTRSADFQKLLKEQIAHQRWWNTIFSRYDLSPELVNELY